MRVLSISLCLLFTVMLSGCLGLFKKPSTEVLTVPVPNVSDGVVKLERSFSADGVAASLGYDHPHDFSAEAMRNEVGLLVVREYEWGKYGMGSKWIPRRVFPKASEERLVPALLAAFEEASRSDKILFDIAGKEDLPTRGEVYLKDNKLVWIFKEIDGVTFLGTDPFMADTKDWTIEEKKGLDVKQNKRTRVIKATRDLSVAAEVTAAAAAVAEEGLTQPPAVAAPEALYRHPGEPIVPPPPGLEELEKKLQTLKKWQESGLITDEDYEKQKAQILEQLQQL